ncbi:MAG: hypothetical protein JJU46_01490, partial [Balneolaceae bacterium]|nr:hypothetical protein [Balneolaceae bacterium]
KRLKTYLLSIFTVGAFAMLMMFTVTTSEDGFDFSLCGETVLANDGECEESDPDYQGPRQLNYTDIPGHELNCSFSGNGCIPCTSTPIPE